MEVESLAGKNKKLLCIGTQLKLHCKEGEQVVVEQKKKKWSVMT